VSSSIIALHAFVAAPSDAMIPAMKVLSLDATDDDILGVCREWVELVATGRFADAIDMLYVPTNYDPSRHWTPESLQTYIGNYGSWDPLGDRRVVRVTPIATARVPANRPGRRPYADAVRLSTDPRAGSVDLDVPLDGEWSDLTAQFEFAPVDGGIWISLYDLHVL
jgi:hypothetical protein